MAKIKDLMDREMNDTWRTHAIHETFDDSCSTCFSEARLIDAKRTVDRDFNKYAHDEAFGHNGQIDDPRFTTNPLG